VIIEGSRGPGFKGSSDPPQIRDIGDLDLIKKGKLGTLKKDIAEIESMLKALIKSLENKPWNP